MSECDRIGVGLYNGVIGSGRNAGRIGQGIGGVIVRLVTSLNHIASIVAGGVVSIGKVAGNIADHSCRGCLPMFQGLLCRVARVAGNIGTGCARVCQ